MPTNYDAHYDRLLDAQLSGKEAQEHYFGWCEAQGLHADHPATEGLYERAHDL